MNKRIRKKVMRRELKKAIEEMCRRMVQAFAEALMREQVEK